MKESDDLDDFLIARLIRSETPQHQLDERVLGHEFNVPRAGVRASLTRLVENGLIRRERRVGTIPLHERWTFDLLRPSRTTTSERRRFQTRTVEQMRVSGAICEELELSPGTAVTRIHRVEVSGDRVLQSWVGWTTVGYDHWLSHVGEFDSTTWNESARRVTGLAQMRVRRTFCTVQASSADVRMFGVELGSPLNFTEIVMRSPDGDFIGRGFGRAPSQHTVTVMDSLVSLESFD